MSRGAESCLVEKTASTALICRFESLWATIMNQTIVADFEMPQLMRWKKTARPCDVSRHRCAFSEIAAMPCRAPLSFSPAQALSFRSKTRSRKTLSAGPRNHPVVISFLWLLTVLQTKKMTRMDGDAALPVCWMISWSCSVMCHDV